jgi:hypothetical protein
MAIFIKRISGPKGKGKFEWSGCADLAGPIGRSGRSGKKGAIHRPCRQRRKLG